MIVTVTANTTIDQTHVVPSLVMNRTIRARQTVFSMGGKPTDASWILGEMGIPSLALGFAAGATGEQVKAMLHARGVTTDFIAVGGETRINTVIVCEDGGMVTITTSTLEVRPEHVEALRRRYLEALEGATCAVLGGTLPARMDPSFYTDFIALARERNIPVVFDAAEPNLSAGLASRPDIVKPNRDELSALVGRPVDSLDDAFHAGREVLERYGAIPVITLGSEGGLAVLADRAYTIPPLELDVGSAGGAGDGVLAGLAAALHRGSQSRKGWLGFAAAAAMCLQLELRTAGARTWSDSCRRLADSV
jgi:1-phosphofructokinase family hexose kinase